VERDGKRYVLPYDIGVRVILYRTDLFRDHGITPPSESWTTNDLLENARKLTQNLDGDGRIDQWGLGIPAARSDKSVFQWLPWFWSLGGDVRPAQGGSFLATPAAVEAMQWYSDLAHRYRVTPPTLYAMDQEAVFQGIAGGLFAMTEGGSWEPSMLKKRSQFGDRIGIALLPSARPGHPAVTLVDGWGFGVLTDDTHKHQAIRRIVEHLSSSGHQVEKYKASGMLPPFENAYTHSLFRDNATGRMLAEAVKSARHPEAEVLSPKVIEALEVAMQDVLSSGVEPRKALERQEKKLDQGSSTENSIPSPGVQQ
jgi:multiple sugar transport system substrate-binding protein